MVNFSHLKNEFVDFLAKHCYNWCVCFALSKTLLWTHLTPIFPLKSRAYSRIYIFSFSLISNCILTLWEKRIVCKVQQQWQKSGRDLCCHHCMQRPMTHWINMVMYIYFSCKLFISLSIVLWLYSVLYIEEKLWFKFERSTISILCMHNEYIEKGESWYLILLLEDKIPSKIALKHVDIIICVR